MRLAVDLGLNVVWPLVFLWGLSDRFTPLVGLGLALIGPLIAALITIVQQRRVSGLSALALIGVLVSGGIGVLQLDARWFAVKEAAIPAIIGALTAASSRTRYALVRTAFTEILDGVKLEAALASRGAQAAAHEVMAKATVRMGGVWLFLGIASGLLAFAMVSGAPGTPAYNEDVGRYTAWSFGLVNLPSMAAMVWVMQKALDEVAAHSGIAIDDLVKAA